MNKELKEKLKFGFIKHKSFLGKGMAELYNFKSVVGFVLLLGIWLQQRNIILPSWLYIIIGIIGGICCWYLGLIWDKSHLYDTEAEFSNKRNPAMRLLKRMSKRKA